MTTDIDSALANLGEALGELADSGQDQLARQLAVFLTSIAHEASRRKSFGKAMLEALTPTDEAADDKDRPKPRRRTPGILDPFEAYRDGEAGLRRQLSDLTLEQLKDIVAEHGMDRDKLAMKWKTPDRLIERIVETVKSRTAKGQVFLR